MFRDVPDNRIKSESAAAEIELLATDVDTSQDRDVSMHTDCHAATDDVFPQHAATDSGHGLAVEKVTKLKLMHRTTCRYQEV